MAFFIWCLVATFALVSAGPSVYDQGPQTFYVSSTPAPATTALPQEGPNKEYVLYLTPDQVKALENAGALVRPQTPLQPEIVPNGEPQVTEEPTEQETEEKETENTKDEIKVDSELDEIFKILNEQRIEEEAAEQREEQEAEEKSRELPARFKIASELQKNKYYAPVVAKKNGIAKSYAYVISHVPNQESQGWRSYERNQEAADSQEENRSEEAPETETDEKNAALLGSLLQRQSISASIIQQKDRLAKNELSLQNKLREIQSISKYNDQKYAIEIEKWRSSLEKQNALAKAEALAKTSSALIKEEILKNRRPVDAVKNVKAPVPTPVIVRVPRPFAVKIPQRYLVAVPTTTTQRPEVERPEVDQRLPIALTKNVYVNLDKPYLVDRIVPVEVNKQITVDGPTRKPEQLTIIRHIWEH